MSEFTPSRALFVPKSGIVPRPSLQKTTFDLGHEQSHLLGNQSPPLPPSEAAASGTWGGRCLAGEPAFFAPLRLKLSRTPTAEAPSTPRAAEERTANPQCSLSGELREPLSEFPSFLLSTSISPLINPNSGGAEDGCTALHNSENLKLENHRMPQYRPPTSDETRLSALEQSHATATQDRAAGRKSITAEVLATIGTFLLVFRPLYQALARSLSGRIKEVRERELARVELDTYVRDFWEVLKRRAYRERQSAAVLAFYGLPADGIIPVLRTFDDLIHAAEQIVRGDADAIAAGHPAMSNPSAAAVAGPLAAARVQAADVPAADRAYTEAQVAIAAQRPLADQHIADVMDDLRSSLRRYDTPTQRRIMRTYGAHFEPLPGEPPDAEPDTPPAPPTPPVP